ncbi:unnamed protein product [Closterium sp. NIES-53]
MALRPSSVPQRVPLLSPPATSLVDGPDPESDLVRAASPTVPRLVATVVTNPSFESVAASALVAELVDFAAACCLDYAASLVAESEANYPPSVGGECALGTDVREDKHPDPALLRRGDYGSLLLLVVEMASWKSTGTYPTFKARYVALGLSQRQGVDFLRTFSPNPKMNSLRVLLHVAAQRDYELLSLDFSTTFLQGSLHEEI